MKIHVKLGNEKKTPFKCVITDFLKQVAWRLKTHATSVHEKKTKNKQSNKKVVNDYDDKEPFWCKIFDEELS